MSVEPEDVERVLGSTDLDPSHLTPFIQSAGRKYDNLTSSESVPSAVRDDVVTWLAAYFVRSGAERQLTSASEGSGSVSFDEDTDPYAVATSLDPTGKLATSDKPSPTTNVPNAKGIE